MEWLALLHYTAYSCKSEVMEFLIDRWANVHARAKNGERLVEITYRSFHSSIEKLLRRRVEEVEKKQLQRRERERQKERGREPDGVDRLFQ